MPARSVSSAISAMRPLIVTCWYQLSLPITVMQTRGSARMFSSRLRVASMFTSTRPSSHRYQVAAVCGEPSGSCDAITEGLGSERNGSSEEGTGGLGMPGVLLRGRAGEVQGVAAHGAPDDPLAFDRPEVAAVVRLAAVVADDEVHAGRDRDLAREVASLGARAGPDVGVVLALPVAVHVARPHGDHVARAGDHALDEHL